eukprot:COSAG02_NODE_750_length_17669_cov_242.395595_10_plen_110_part_00
MVVPRTGALGTNSASGNGFGGGDQKFAVDANDRVLDPIVLSRVGAGKNMSDSGTDVATLDKFEALWASVNSTRDEMLPSNLPSSSNVGAAQKGDAKRGAPPYLAPRGLC